MSENTAQDETPETPQTEAEQTEAVEPEQVDKSKASREAARYRVRAKTAEEQLAQTSARLDALQRQVIEHRLDGLNPAAFWKLRDNQLDGLVDDDGRINTDAVTQAVEALRTAYGLTRRSAPIVPDVGQQPEVARAHGFDEAFSPRRGQ
ncbi:hypothetical protein FEZ32_00565 [Acidipropionibacterium jensenii]|uniref:hypothetical protein n=1 Tax=Acidipropionibacterium jensenii TaxID=1749 RepID=UPI00110AF2FF|nr:hypothetical protein [Acidipropionibacterium jensenii]QCV87059.1 hypothetical protein FEZ32_00565 [Acidipropionibacterium jensenii]